ncbi:MAG: hypothetical protein RIG63_13965 [Coleofasciculus chthonoplastes F3-SA18-01]|uniref:hypothetical protein n=1 Tax=Coleofasciculus chthonoplastes TaxID=64178 RepID=UPI0032F575EF
MHCSYNAVNNAPFIQKGQEHHQYRPLIKVPDSIIKDRGYDSVWKQHKFHPSETDNNLGKGVFYRQAWTS